MSRLASDLIDRALYELTDRGHVTSTEDELFGWTNDGIKDICLLNPGASVEVGLILLSPGSKQSLGYLFLPSGLTAKIHLLVDVIRNMGSTFSTPGSAVTLVDRSELGATALGVFEAFPSSEVIAYAYDEKESQSDFYVWPPQPANFARGTLEVVASVAPSAMAKVAAPNEYDVEIPIGDEHFNVLLDYVLFRAFEKDADTSEKHAERSETHYRLYMAGLGK